MKFIRYFISKAHMRQGMMRIIFENKIAQDKNEIYAAGVMTIVQQKLKLTIPESMDILAYLFSTGLVDTVGDSPKQKLYLTEKGKSAVEARTLISEHWKRVENRFTNITLVAANLILVIGFFSKDTQTADAINSLNKQIQNIETAITKKELKISLTLDTTQYRKRDSIPGD